MEKSASERLRADRVGESKSEEVSSGSFFRSATLFWRAQNRMLTFSDFSLAGTVRQESSAAGAVRMIAPRQGTRQHQGPPNSLAAQSRSTPRNIYALLLGEPNRMTFERRVVVAFVAALQEDARPRLPSRKATTRLIVVQIMPILRSKSVERGSACVL